MLIDEDPLVQRIEDILDGREWILLIVEWSETSYSVTIGRRELDEGLTYSVRIDDGIRSVVYLRGLPLRATWIERPQYFSGRGWWQLSACGVEFLDAVLGACLDAAWRQ